MSNDLHDAKGITSISVSTPDRRFVRDVIKWVRSTGELHTHVMPDNYIPGDNGAHRFSGYLLRPTRAGTMAYAALFVTVVSTIVVMAAGSARSGAMEAVGNAGFALAGALVVATYVSWRRAKIPVEVVALQDAVVRPERVTAVWSAEAPSKGSSQRWLVARGAFTEEARAEAKAAGVRCISVEGAGSHAVARARDASRATESDPAPTGSHDHAPAAARPRQPSSPPVPASVLADRPPSSRARAVRPPVSGVRMGPLGR
jgi:hypothetical protein